MGNNQNAKAPKPKPNNKPKSKPKSKPNNKPKPKPNNKPKSKPNNISMSMMVLGDENSGKTALIQRYYNRFGDKKEADADIPCECRLEKDNGELHTKTKITLSIEAYSRGGVSNKQIKQYKRDLLSEEHQVYILCFAANVGESFNSAMDDYHLLQQCKKDVKRQVMFAATGYALTKGNINSTLYSMLISDGMNAETDENVNLLFEKAVANQLGCDGRCIVSLYDFGDDITDNELLDEDDNIQEVITISLTDESSANTILIQPEKSPKGKEYENIDTILHELEQHEKMIIKVNEGCLHASV